MSSFTTEQTHMLWLAHIEHRTSELTLKLTNLLYGFVIRLYCDWQCYSNVDCHAVILLIVLLLLHCFQKSTETVTSVLVSSFCLSFTVLLFSSWPLLHFTFIFFFCCIPVCEIVVSLTSYCAFNALLFFFAFSLSASKKSDACVHFCIQRNRWWWSFISVKTKVVTV